MQLNVDIDWETSWVSETATHNNNCGLDLRISNCESLLFIEVGCICCMRPQIQDDQKEGCEPGNITHQLAQDGRIMLNTQTVMLQNIEV